MKKSAAIILVLAASALAADKPQPINVDYLGHACFVITSPAGVKVLMDPYDRKVGYPVKEVKADIVTVSHEHSDHNNVDMATGEPRIIRGLENGDWAKVDEKVGDVRIRSVKAFHDDSEGSKRGKDAIMILEMDNVNLVHLGDLGQMLSEEQVEAIGRVDVLMIPVGGFFTIDAAEAGRVIEKLRPKLVIPMHYKTSGVMLPIAGLDKFIQGKDSVVRPGSSTYQLKELPEKLTYLVLDPVK